MKSLIVISSMLLGAIAEGVEANELLNGSFENGGVLPDQWDLFGSGEAMRTFGAAFDGDWDVTLGGTGLALLYQRIAGQAGREYAVSARVRSVSDASTASLKIEFHDSAESKISERVLDLVATASWVDYRVEEVAPANTSLVTATVVGNSGAATAFDFVRLGEVIPKPVREFDLHQTGAPFLGFGSQIWGYDSNPAVMAKALGELNLRWLRVENHDENPSWTQMRDTRLLTDSFGAEWIYMVWSAPAAFRSGGLLADPVGFAGWWADHVETAYQQGVPVEFIELMNEPDSNGLWSTGISPADYNVLVGSTRGALDAKGLTQVEIVGPGLSAMSWSKPQGYFDALDSLGWDSLAAISTHSWQDEVFNCTSASAECLENNWFNFEDRPLNVGYLGLKIVTEHATKETCFFGIDYPSPETSPFYNATHSMPYAIRTCENTLALLNSGAQAILYWQVMDEPTEVLDKSKGWGFLDLTGNEKPVYVAARSLSSQLPVGARPVQAPNQDSSEVYTAVFVDRQKVIVAATNSSESAQSATLRLRHAPRGLRVQYAEECVLGVPGNPSLEIPDQAQIVAVAPALAGESQGALDLTLALSPNSLQVVTLQGHELRAEAVVNPK